MNFCRENLIIESLDGYILSATLDYPLNSEIKGGFLLLHGCPSYKEEYGFYGYETGMNKVGMSEFFASKGYVCLRFNYRSQGKDILPEEMNDLSINGMVNDTESAFLLLKSKVDHDLNIVATSFAASIALLWMQSYQHKINHLFFMCPLLELRDTLRNRNIIIKNDYGIEVVSPDVVEELDKQSFIIAGERKMTRTFINEVLSANTKNAFKNLLCKSTIFHGTMDTTVNYKTSVEYQNITPDNCKLILMEDLLHGFGPRKDLGYTSNQRSKLKYETWQKIYYTMEKEI